MTLLHILLATLAGGVLSVLLAACRTLGTDSENRPRRDQFLPDLPSPSPAMGQRAGEKWAGAAGLQPVIPKSDRLLGATLALSDAPEFENAFPELVN